MGSSVLEKYRLKLQNDRKIFQNRIFKKLHWVLGSSSIKSEDVVGESTCRSTGTKKHSTNTGVRWAAMFRTRLHVNRSANETNQNDYLQNGCGFLWFFPTWICLTDIEPPLFIFAKTEQRTVASNVLSGIWFG